MRLALMLCPFALQVIALPAAAQNVDCANAAAQVELSYCAEQDWLVADADLNAAYLAARAMMRAIDANLPAADQGAEVYLRDAQRAWIAFRDTACAAEGYVMHGGSGEPMLIYGCMARLSAVRAEDLWVLSQTY